MKILISDYDGTLDRNDCGVTAEDRAAIRKWREAGNLFAIATGRSLGDIGTIAKSLNADYVICCGGGDIFGRTLYPIKKFSATRQALEDLIGFLNRYNCRFITIRSQSEEYCIGLSENGILELPPEVSGFEGFSFDSFGLPSKKMAEEMTGLFDGRISVIPTDGGIDIAPWGVNKAAAINYIIKRIPIDSSNVITVGDSNNDAEMISEFNGVTVSNGNSYIKSIARAVYNDFTKICEDNM